MFCVFQGFRNDFQEAMDKVDEAYLNEILALGTHVSRFLQVLFYFAIIFNLLYNINNYKNLSHDF